jgi:hypothetical protein
MILLSSPPHSPNQRKFIRRWQVSVTAVVTHAMFLLFAGDFNRATNAAPLYDKFTKYIQKTSETFLTAASATAVTPIVTAFLELIPWGILLLAGGVISWQAYAGYQAYEREDLSGVGKAVLNIVVMLLLLVMTSFVTDFIVSGTGGGAG